LSSAIVNALLIPPALALAISASTIVLLMHSRASTLALDFPNPRSLHLVPMPRLGGIGIIAGVAGAWLYAGFETSLSLILTLVLLIAISLLDDIFGVAVQWRFLVHLAGASLGISAVLHVHQPWLLLLAAIATAWMINLFNFMDGSDGLAGGMAVIGFGAYGLAALAAGDFSFAAINLSIAASALGFLMFNFPPARVFMGDAGAIPLGFLAAIMNISGAERSDWPAWLGLVVFSPFIVDASVTLCRRLSKRAKVWQAHKEHYYQRLVQSGWGHRKTALAEYALMLICGVAAVAGTRLEAPAQAGLVAGFGLGYAALIYALERTLPRLA
jgi:UDP-N-acetylmuramyl pentapeptide phosphotransferase/UDP-N-acetylglucosamine-1-phosphate transferase